MKAKLSPEQERLLNWLKAEEGGKPATLVMEWFSKSTINSLIWRGLIRGDWETGHFTIQEVK